MARLFISSCPNHQTAWAEVNVQLDIIRDAGLVPSHRIGWRKPTAAEKARHPHRGRWWIELVTDPGTDPDMARIESVCRIGMEKRYAA